MLNNEYIGEMLTQIDGKLDKLIGLLEKHEPLENFTLTEKNLERIISDYLRELNPCVNLNGFIYLKEIVKLCISENITASNITTQIYPEIAKKFNIAPSCIERCIRHYILKTFSQENNKKLCEIFKLDPNKKITHVTNKYFISAIIEEIRTKYNV